MDPAEGGPLRSLIGRESAVLGVAAEFDRDFEEDVAAFEPECEERRLKTRIQILIDRDRRSGQNGGLRDAQALLCKFLDELIRRGEELDLGQNEIAEYEIRILGRRRHSGEKPSS